MRQVCGGLAEAHRFGLVHRDLKPANILVAILGGKCDVAKVLDFGLVKLTATPDAPAVDSRLHRQRHAAVHVARAGGRDQARSTAGPTSTPWARSSTSCSPGDRRSRERTRLELMIAHARDPVVPPSKHRGDVPSDLEAVVIRCLAKKPDDRYPDARALAAALAACACAGDWDDEKAEQWWIDQANTHLEGGAQPA